VSVVAVLLLVVAVSLGAPLFVRPALVRLGVMDTVTARSSHESPTVRGVGAAGLLAGVLGLTLFAWMSPTNGEKITLLTIVFVGASSALIGLAEDLKGLSVRIRLSLQLSIGLVGTGVLLAFAGQPLLLAVLGGIFVAGMVNVANFMDGINAISGLHAILFGIAYTAVGMMTGQLWLSISGLVLACALGGFLPWNLLGRGAFLGDVGSYFLGGTIGAIAVAALINGTPLLAVFGPLAIYLVDTVAAVARRVAAGEKWWEAHCSHTFQQISQRGLSHAWTTLVVGGFTMLTSLIGLLSLSAGGPGTVMLGGLMLLVCASYLLTPRALRAFREHPVQSRAHG
jgi:UDP-GlcNAc:undecaprenyl-phosphate GlcNAc-1-phosphate transferase